MASSNAVNGSSSGGGGGVFEHMMAMQSVQAMQSILGSKEGTDPILMFFKMNIGPVD